MTLAGTQLFCKSHNNNLGDFDGKEVNSGSVRERNKALYLFNTHFSLIWKSQSISFNKAIEGLKLNFEIVDNVTS